VKHLRRSITWADATGWSDSEVIAEFAGDLARTMETERILTAEESAVAGRKVRRRKASARCTVGVESEETIRMAVEKARQKESMPMRFMRRTRHWVDGGIIGSKLFVQDLALGFEERERVLKKVLSRGEATGGVLHCFKRLTC
jgi:hypothetical protein